MVEFEASPVPPGGVKHWSCASKRWLQGNIGCVILGVGAAGAAHAEALLMWNFPYSGEDRVGVRLGAPGQFTKMSSVSLTGLFGDALAHSADTQAVALGDVVAGSSFGRDPAIFVVAPAAVPAATLAVAPPSAPFDAKARCFVGIELANRR
jgi:hypothetical protein